MADDMKKVPKIFISYSWSSSERVLELAQRLMDNGVEVILDKWDLKEGQDKYAFMEQCVTDPVIDKVLLICDKAYTEKADSRDGGVGDETMIISPEIYKKATQEKFIPVILEADETGTPYRPAYIKSRIYVDLSNEDDSYEIEYEKLLRNIHNRPIYKKPAVGKVPEWIENETVNLAPIRDLIKQTRGYIGGNKTKADFILRNYTSKFITALCDLETPTSDETLLKVIDKMKPLRDLYVDFIEAIIYADLPICDTITSFFEQMYNTTHDATGRRGYSDSDFEQYDFFIWECFIATTAVLLFYEQYKELHDILCHSYFLRENYFSSDLKDYNYTFFRAYIRTIEDKCKPKCDDPKIFTLAGRMLIQREKKPTLTLSSISSADIILYQLYNILDLKSEGHGFWFPMSYHYCPDKYSMWSRLKSQKYCEKVLPLFGAISITELKEKISVCKNDRSVRHSNCFESVPNILNSIKVEEVASIY